MVSLIEVLDADTRLLETRDALAQARTETARAAVASFDRSAADGIPAHLHLTRSPHANVEMLADRLVPVGD